MVRPGVSPFTLGRNSEQKMKKAELEKKKNKKKLGYHLHDITGFIVVSLQHESYAPHSDLFWSQKETLLLQEAKNPQKH